MRVKTPDCPLCGKPMVRNRALPPNYSWICLKPHTPEQWNRSFELVEINMPALINVSFSRGAMPTWKPDLFPGSPEARAQGCTCPESQSNWMQGKLTFSADCPVHELEEVKK